MRALAAILIFAMSLGTSAGVRAQDDADQGLAEVSPATPRPERRPLPDYDGRPEANRLALDIALGIPRAIFGPIYFVAEYLLRRPLGLVASSVTESERSEQALDYFRFGPDRRYTLIPTLRVDAGQRTNLGFYFHARDAGAEDNDIRFTAAFGWLDWLSADFVDRWTHGDLVVEGHADFDLRGDALFWGLGREASVTKRSGFEWTGAGASLGFHHRVWRRSQVSLDAGVRWYETRNRSDDQGPSLIEGAAAGLYPLPAGFEEDVITGHVRGRLLFDSRRQPPAAETGVRLELAASVHADIVEGGGERSWVDWFARFAGLVDLSGNRNILGFHLLARFTDRIRGEIPFLSLPELSGPGVMPGFRPGMLRGASLLSSRISYRWPIASFLEGEIDISVGGAFAEYLRDIRPEDLRLAFHIGIHGTPRRDHFFQLLFGLGTAPFGEGTRVDSLRFIFGGSRAF